MVPALGSATVLIVTDSATSTQRTGSPGQDFQIRQEKKAGHIVHQVQCSLLLALAPPARVAPKLHLLPVLQAATSSSGSFCKNESITATLLGRSTQPNIAFPSIRDLLAFQFSFLCPKPLRNVLAYHSTDTAFRWLNFSDRRINPCTCRWLGA